jgi:hypothetical protein
VSPGRRGDSGKLTRRAALALLAGGGLASLGLSGAFSSVSGPRGFDIGTTDDSRALLRLESTTSGDPPRTPLNRQVVTISGSDGEVVDMVHVANFLGEDVVFSALRFEPQSGGSPLSVDIQDPPSSLSDQTDTTLSAKLGCSRPVEGEPTDLVVVAEGPTTTVELTRTVAVTCTRPLCDVTTDLIAGRSGDDSPAGSVDVLRTSDNRLEIDVVLSRADSGGKSSGGDDDDDDDDDDEERGDDEERDDDDEDEDEENDDGDEDEENDDDDEEDDEENDDDDEDEDEERDDDDEDEENDDDDEDGVTTLEEVHVDVRTDPCDFPNGLGQYRLVDERLGTTAHSVSFDLDALGIGRDESVAIAVHAALSDGESAWAAGPAQPDRGGWRMYVDGCYDGTTDDCRGPGGGNGNGEGNGNGRGNGEGNGRGEGNGDEDDD